MFNSCQDKRPLEALFAVFLDDTGRIQKVTQLPIRFSFSLRL
jgi:hypothetical protein